MKFSSLILLASAFMLLSFAACAPAHRTRVILIPDPDGKVGEITVQNKGGAQIMTQAGQMAEVHDEATAPVSPASVMDDKEIHRIFGDVLAALPEKPLTFILYFKTNSFELNIPSLKVLNSAHEAISSRQSEDISVIGHTDRVGTDEKNYILSRKRALSVKKYLVVKGVHPDAIELDYHGEANPLVKTAEGVAEPRNRRVEVIVR
ncbi:OmpA family protein [Syntrophus aciditrophicus]|uniref:Outer membrane protein n=1 Tax=Syntrophus aciditrophicus (strain SB) TaxID=56780 RepID=Q2LX51_SYNAS|nr:OmpA family protein [Syntrophus aciditrophicus]ABC78659.1 outer membrane protein [Syntrophus aciditrophicus SB]OPY16829.1 MAG: Outer membrane protein P5 precursor [Syntrophus sp. PtaB.Bin075]